MNFFMSLDYIKKRKRTEEGGGGIIIIIMFIPHSIHPLLCSESSRIGQRSD